MVTHRNQNVARTTSLTTELLKLLPDKWALGLSFRDTVSSERRDLTGSQKVEE